MARRTRLSDEDRKLFRDAVAGANFHHSKPLAAQERETELVCILRSHGIVAYAETAERAVELAQPPHGRLGPWAEGADVAADQPPVDAERARIVQHSLECGQVAVHVVEQCEHLTTVARRPRNRPSTRPRR